MAQQKERFTVWLDPDVLAAARARAGPGGSVSEVLAAAAKQALLRTADDDRAALLRAVDRVFYAVRRADERRALELRTLQEMLGLSVLSFLNHTPAVAEADKRAALVSGKLRFERFLDTLAANLRGGRSVLRDVADPPNLTADDAAGPPREVAAADADGGDATHLAPTELPDPATEDHP